MAVWQKIIPSLTEPSECSAIVGVSGLKGSGGVDFINDIRAKNRLVVPLCHQHGVVENLDSRYDDTTYYDGDTGVVLGDFNNDFNDDFFN